jgi:2-polyprenyl-3-methyl-5-hydroxy-6-metoxy-1,4-benzoquinol methylase
MVEISAVFAGRQQSSNASDLAMLGAPRWVAATQKQGLLSEMGNLLRRIAVRCSTGCRYRRAGLFIDRLQPTVRDKILDLGGGKGGYLAGIIPYRSNVTVADVDPAQLKLAEDTYGFSTVCLDGSAKFAIADQEYDVLFSSSVIEHVTGPRDVIFDITDDAEFTASAKEAQANFASEIRRVAKRYFVQTPYKYFPLEPHSFLPFFIVWLPRRWQIKALAFFGRHWIKAVQADFRLLTITEMQALFPDAEIVLERYCGFVKSIVAIKA